MAFEAKYNPSIQAELTRIAILRTAILHKPCKSPQQTEQIQLALHSLSEAESALKNYGYQSGKYFQG